MKKSTKFESNVTYKVHNEEERKDLMETQREKRKFIIIAVMVAVILILGTYEVVTGIIDIASVKEAWIMAINNPVYVLKNAIMLIALIGAITYLLNV